MDLAAKAAAARMGLVGASPPAAPKPVGPAAIPASPPTSSARKPLAEIVLAWAADLNPAHAPPVGQKGPLAWVRGTKVPELLALLEKEGYR